MGNMSHITGISITAALAVLVAVASVVGTYTLTAAKADSNTGRITKLEKLTESNNQAVKDVSEAVETNENRLREQSRGINWIGKALEKIAADQNVSLPARPVVSED